MGYEAVVRRTRVPGCSRLGSGVTAHLKMNEVFVGAQHEAGGEEHGALLLGDRLCALPLTALDFLQELPG